MKTFFIFCTVMIFVGGLAFSKGDFESPQRREVRVATFNASLNRGADGQLVEELASGDDPQAWAVAEIIQRTQPDILLINEFDYDASGQAAELFRNDYLAVSRNGARPIDYPYLFVAPSNTGVPSGHDLDNDGSIGGPGDALGFGFFPGQFGMVIYSKYPIDVDRIRTFRNLLWRDMPNALLPDDWYTQAELAIVPLSSKSHWDIPISVGNDTIHLLASHPTPPVFDGPEDRNGRRNHDEIRFWADYVTPEQGDWIYDDDGRYGGLPDGERFVIAGDLNADPQDGDSTNSAIRQLIEHAAVNVALTPSSEGGVEQATLQRGANANHGGDPRFDTADFSDENPGNLRVDYLLPAIDLPIVGAAVFWPTSDDPAYPLVVPSSDHRLVWIDVAIDFPASNGFRTAHGAMLKGAIPGVEITPLINVGERLDTGYRFDSLPDGVAIDPRRHAELLPGHYYIYVNHENSTIPFRGQADFRNAQLSRLIVDGKRQTIVDGSFVVTGEQKFVRFCSNFFAGEAEGFEQPMIFLNEESSNMLNPGSGAAYPAGENGIQAGRVVAYSPDLRDARVIWGLGRHNHENTVAIPGYNELILLSGDDTFSAPSSQLYLYRAADSEAVWEDRGTLWAFKADGGINDYGDLSFGDQIGGRFVPVPDEIARGDQRALEDWSNRQDIFQFIRIEDIAYDRERPNVVYFADTGEPRAQADPATGRLTRAPRGTKGLYPNGRIFRLELDTHNPTMVRSLSILLDGDAAGAESAGDVSLLHNPDNIETTPGFLWIQEDPGGQNRYAADDPDGAAARIWQYDLRSGRARVVAEVDQSDKSARLGDWESSGIVDASSIFGPGYFLVTIQAHSLKLKSRSIPDPANPTETIRQKMEGGQLLLVRFPN